MRRLLFLAAATAAMATCTWVVAWWMVPVVAAVFGWVRRDDAATPLLAGLAGFVAWGALLLVAGAGPEASVMNAVGRAMQVGPRALVGLTLAYPALLAASAAGVVRAAGARRA